MTLKRTCAVLGETHDSQDALELAYAPPVASLAMIWLPQVVAYATVLPPTYFSAMEESHTSIQFCLAHVNDKFVVRHTCMQVGRGSVPEDGNAVTACSFVLVVQRLGNVTEQVNNELERDGPFCG
jgi:hypothetical protein